MKKMLNVFKRKWQSRGDGLKSELYQISKYVDEHPKNTTARLQTLIYLKNLFDSKKKDKPFIFWIKLKMAERLGWIFNIHGYWFSTDKFKAMLDSKK